MSIFRRMANLLHRSRIDRDIDAELQAHVALRTEDNWLPACRLTRPGVMRWCALATVP